MEVCEFLCELPVRLFFLNGGRSFGVLFLAKKKKGLGQLFVVIYFIHTIVVLGVY